MSYEERVKKSIPGKGVAIQVGTCYAVPSTGGIATSSKQGYSYFSHEP